ncbi:MAG: SUMF1/EgtB/PvdO family nonheme iron enzyme [Magnetococcales bacterium]|nr:SUMF1/EgtB/PvdO family nonheme iron enzyme [Magnetococcales bacterium]
MAGDAKGGCREGRMVATLRESGVKRLVWLGVLGFLSACGPLDFSPLGSGTPGPVGAVEWVSRDWPTGGHYEGELLNGKRHGKGSFTWPDGASYTGEYRHDERTGYGIFSWPNGSRYEGQFVAGKRHGKGSFIWPDGARYAGEYQNGQRHGQGTFYSADKSVVVCQSVPQEESQEWMDGRFMGGTAVAASSLASPAPVVTPAALPPPSSVVAGRSSSPTTTTREAERHSARLDVPTARSSASLPLPAVSSPAALSPAASSSPPAAASPASFSTPPDFDARPAASAVSGAARERAQSASSRSAGTLDDSTTRVSAPPPPTGNVWRESRTGMTFVRVPGGCFRMGSARGGPDERSLRSVCVDSFWLGRYEVTREEWEKIMGSPLQEGPRPVVERQEPRRDPREPVESVSWNDIQNYMARFTQVSGARFRLPTEAEWEYACRSGGRDQLYCGDDKPEAVAWFEGNSQGTLHPVGGKEPNGLGLYDMSGNLWEWVADWYEPEYTSPDQSRNPAGPLQGDGKVLRGGAWLSGAQYIRATQRYRFPPDRRYNLLGFRLVYTP